jgi:transcriptional regulator with XRE-family HTH domain
VLILTFSSIGKIFFIIPIGDKSNGLVLITQCLYHLFSTDKCRNFGFNGISRVFNYLSMTFGERITYQRKQKKWSQDDLAKRVGTSAPIIGRYERDEIKPSIEVAARIAAELEVTIDYLINGTAVVLDKDNIRRLQEIEKLIEQDKLLVLTTIDALLRDAKARKAYSK